MGCPLMSIMRHPLSSSYQGLLSYFDDATVAAHFENLRTLKKFQRALNLRHTFYWQFWISLTLRIVLKIILPR